MRALLAAAAVAAALLIGGCGGGSPTVGTTVATTVTPPPSATAPEVTTPILSTQPAPAGAPSVLMVGDSLGVGTEPFLPRLLPGWLVVQDVFGGRTLADGMAIWRARSDPFTVSAFSLLTNDDPSAVAQLEPLARETVERVFSRCVVWATIAHPPSITGVSYEAINAMLRRVADAYGPARFQLVPWAETVRARPELLLGDGVHATEEGYRVRAELYADAVRRCGGG